MGGLHGGFCSFSVALRWRYFPKNAPKKWAIYTGPPVLSPLRCLFFFGTAYTGFRSFSVALFVFFKFAFGRFIWGLPFFLYSATCSFLGGGVRFFSAFNAVLFCTFVVWRVVRAFSYVFFVVFGRWGACLGLPSIGFVNAV